MIFMSVTKRFGYLSIGFLIATLLFSFPLGEKCEGHPTPGSDQKNSYLILIPPYFVLSYGIKTYFHEAGHVLFATLAGAKEARITQWNLFWGRASWRWVRCPQIWQRVMASGGGMTLTRILAEGTDMLLDRELVPDYVVQPLGMFYMVARFDMPNYVLKSSFDRFIMGESSPHDDVYRITSALSELFLRDWVGIPEERQRKKEEITDLLYAGWILACSLDLYYDWPEIMRNYVRLTTGSEKDAKDVLNRELNFNFKIREGELELTLSYSF